MKLFSPAFLGALILCFQACIHAKDAAPPPQASPTASPDGGGTQADREKRIAWWRNARFGMFVHFGLYAIPARGEWVQWNEQIPVEEYALLAAKFHPVSGPEEWASVAKDAGMQYMVLTSRHHDGFSLFDTKAGDFNSVKTSSQRDFVAEFMKAARARGLHAGLYYSPLDWRFPGFMMPDLQRAGAEKMRAQYHLQIEELLSNYGPIDILWFDGGEADWLSFGGDWKGAAWKKRPTGDHYRGGFSWNHDAVYRMLRRLQPDILINGRADMPEDFHSREGDGALGDFDNAHPWELCTTLAGAWGYQENTHPKSLADCIRLLVNVAGRDGNLLLNVGPKPDGSIETAQAVRLREIGGWLALYGESIYGTRGGPYMPCAKSLVSTRKGNFVFLHVLDWPTGALSLPAPGKPIKNVSILGGNEIVFSSTAQGTVTFEVPMEKRRPLDTILKLELAGNAMDLPLVETKGTLSF